MTHEYSDLAHPNFSQIECYIIILISIASGLTLLVLIIKKVLPSTKEKNIFYLVVSATFPLYTLEDQQCEATVLTSFILVAGLTLTWIINIRYSSHALVLAHKPVPLQQLLSSYEGYKCFIRFLVSELSIENLEFYQLSMRWRYRICCWLHGVENGSKPPAPHIKLTCPVLSFQYLDRLLPQQHGGGLVPNFEEQIQIEMHAQKMGAHAPQLSMRDSQQYFATLPLSRRGSMNSAFTTPNHSNMPSRTNSPRFAGSGGPSMTQIIPAHSSGEILTVNQIVPAASSLRGALPPTIMEGADEEEEITQTNTAMYTLQDTNTFHDDDQANMTDREYSQSSLIHKQMTWQYSQHSTVSALDQFEQHKLQKFPPSRATVRVHGAPHMYPMKKSASIQSDDTNPNPMSLVDRFGSPSRNEFGNISSPPSQFATSNNTAAATPTNEAASGNEDNATPSVHEQTQYQFKQIPQEHEMIDNMQPSDNQNLQEPVLGDDISDEQLTEVELTDNATDNTLKPSMIAINPSLSENRNPDELKQHLTPVHSKESPIKTTSYGTEPETPVTPEPNTKTMQMFIEEADDEETSPLQQPRPAPTTKQTVPMPDITPQISIDEDEGMEYLNYDDDATLHTVPTGRSDTKEDPDSANSPKKDVKAKRIVRFAETATVKEMEANSPSLQTPPTKHKKKGITMHDILGTKAKQKKTSTKANNSDKTLKFDLDRGVSVEESVVSKAEPSWFAAWFRKSNVESGQEERAQTLMHYSDLSWRRMRKVAKEVNMSSIARDNLSALFKKYPKGRLLETKRITLDEYDEAMRDAWISAWENMNDSLRRFGKSEHYEKYLANSANISVRKLNLLNNGSVVAEDEMNVKKLGNDGIAIRGNVVMMQSEENGVAVPNGSASTNSEKSTKFNFQIGPKLKNGKTSSEENTTHERTSPILM